VSPERHAEAYFGLLDDLEGLFGRRRVDLVETGVVHNPYLRQEIEERKQLLVGGCDRRQPEGVEV
jgi:predicted nucleotidyltransferase